VHITPRDTGWIEVICGSMFSGKTEELLRRIRLAQIAKRKVAVFKPKIDDRYAADHVVSHDARKVPSTSCNMASEIWTKSVGEDGKPLFEVIGIDEAQFFGLDLVEVCEKLADAGLRVIVSGLDQDSRGVPFEPIPQLLAVAEFITKNLAICVVCGNPSNRSQRLVNREARVLVGAADAYEARCRKCFRLPEGETRQRILPLGKLQ
jgi:thymidine kinase